MHQSFTGIRKFDLNKVASFSIIHNFLKKQFSFIMAIVKINFGKTHMVNYFTYQFLFGVAGVALLGSKSGSSVLNTVSLFFSIGNFVFQLAQLNFRMFKCRYSQFFGKARMIRSI